jgi:enoyl-CoA hydratase/carnithine racemase
MSADLRQTRKGNVVVLALDRPERRNAMDISVTRNLADTFDSLVKDETVNAVILQGHSHGFGAGTDLKALGGQTVTEMVSDEREMAALARSFNRYPKPIIAAVDGFAIGGGAVFAASCDVVFTSEAAKWALPEVPIGWNAAYGIAALQARLGAITARHILWGVDMFDGLTAHKLGLADFISKDSAAESALAYAQKLAAMPMHAVLATKRLTVAAIDRESTSLDNLAIKAFADCLAFDEAQATLRKFGMVG